MENSQEILISKEEFNDEPVYFCKHCLSLTIKSLGDYEFCDICGSTDILTTHINKWNSLYKDKYGVEYLKTKTLRNGRN